ncbi:MAG: methylisocitrate lyase [Gammaproteobacteria bacterium]|nr:methylisocitrate lyase [Gammaproteobacteria bacterium]
MQPDSPGARFRAAIEADKPLQIPGTINAYCALLAQRAGFKAIYLSGAGVANASFGMPDLAVTTMNDVAEDTRRITGICDLPLLVDIDTGWGTTFNIARTIAEMQRAGAAAVHIEDQVMAKRCGHRPNKTPVPVTEMTDRIKSAVDARTDERFVIMARTDAFASEGEAAAVERTQAYVEAGADMIFAEALYTLENYRAFTAAIKVPVLANLTEFGRTPAFTRAELSATGISMILYPLSAFRAMSQAALKVYETILRDGTQTPVIDSMQTREALYDVLGYHAWEQRLDALQGKSGDDQ